MFGSSYHLENISVCKWVDIDQDGGDDSEAMFEKDRRKQEAGSEKF